MYTWSAQLTNVPSWAVQVNDKLQVVGQSNVFAIGDATDVKETKVRCSCGVRSRVAMSVHWNCKSASIAYNKRMT